MKHVFTQGRCIFCNINDLDMYSYGPEECAEREEPIVYMVGPEGTQSSIDLPPEHMYHGLTALADEDRGSFDIS